MQTQLPKEDAFLYHETETTVLPLTPTSTLADIGHYIQKVAKGAGKDPMKRALAKLELAEKFNQLGYSKDRHILIGAGFPPPTTTTKGKAKAAGTSENVKPKVVDEGVISIEEVITQVQSHLTFDDAAAIHIILGTIAAHEIGEKPPWLFVVAPPSGAKGELISMLRNHPKTYYLSKLTAHTFVSGLDAKDAVRGEDPSLLLKLKDNILIMKDFTTILSMHMDAKKEIFASLREIYDGEMSERFGTGQEIDWAGHMSFIAGVTTSIDHQHTLMSSLGPRFLFLRLKQPDRIGQINRALAMVGGWKLPLSNSVTNLLRQLPPIKDTIFPSTHLSALSALSDIVSTARSVVYRGKDDDLNEVPEAEMGARVAIQLKHLAIGIANVNKRQQVEMEDMRKVVRVGFDSIIPKRAWVIQQLARLDRPGIASIRQGSTYSDYMITQALEELILLGVVESIGELEHGKLYQLRPQMKAHLLTLAPYLDKRGN